MKTSNPNINECGTPNNEETVWDDLLINSGLFKFAGSNDPTWRDWQPAGSGTTFKVLKFEKNDEIFFSCQMPHTYKNGSDIRVHVHWTPCDRGVAESGNSVGWKIDLSWASINTGSFPASTTYDMQSVCTGTNDYHEVGALLSPYIDGTGQTISSMLICRLYRTDTGTDDTWVGTTTQSPALLQCDFHHEIDMNGSRSEWIK